MDSKEFKILFGNVAKENGFERVFGGWSKESLECIVVLYLQKSNYSNLFYLNIKIFIQGTFDNTYQISKDLVKNAIGNIFERPPEEFRDIFDLEAHMSEWMRKKQLVYLFCKFLVPLTDKALSRAGINELVEQKKIFLTPAVKKELEKQGNIMISNPNIRKNLKGFDVTSRPMNLLNANFIGNATREYE